MEEAGIPGLIDGPEFSCFERLYQDALRRQRDYKERMQTRSFSSPTHGAGVAVVQRQFSLGRVTNSPSVTTEGFGLQRASSQIDYGGASEVSASPLPPGNAGFQRGGGYYNGQSADTASGTRVSFMQPRPSGLGQGALRDVLQQGMATRSSSIGRLLVRPSVSPGPAKRQVSPDASTPTPPPAYLSFSHFVPEGLKTGVPRRASRSPSPTDDRQPKLIRARTEPGNLPPLDATPENISPNSRTGLPVTATFGAANKRSATPPASDGNLNQTLGRMRGHMLVGRHQAPGNDMWEPSRRVLYRAPREERGKKAAPLSEAANLGGSRRFFLGN